MARENMNITGQNLKPGTRVISTLDGEPGTVVRVSTYRRNGQRAWSYIVDTAYGREVWQAGDVIVRK